ncbi:hypothetical protein M378DRAFT_358529 [Amanita muscaria Koide BX008]|uniref:Uncharacterized protein n=1 Tax=Amanita muscaria (strain Koide BX008) TaxID=946122 RepID=A0A0C2SV11_AMAMK|nr:hypothetical protein M378DRAFT_358529 [Amanita muscaria Koide BX008]
MIIGCDIGYKICGVLGIIGRVSVLFVWGLRTYALYNGSKLILAWFVTLGSACFISHIVHVAGNRCYEPALYPLCDMVLSVVVCCFEFSATFLTVIRSVRTLRDLKGVDGWDQSLYYLILKQAILYTAFSYRQYMPQFSVSWEDRATHLERSDTTNIRHNDSSLPAFPSQTG